MRARYTRARGKAKPRGRLWAPDTHRERAPAAGRAGKHVGERYMWRLLFGASRAPLADASADEDALLEDRRDAAAFSRGPMCLVLDAGGQLLALCVAELQRGDAVRP